MSFPIGNGTATADKKHKVQERARHTQIWRRAYRHTRLCQMATEAGESCTVGRLRTLALDEGLDGENIGSACRQALDEVYPGRVNYPTTSIKYGPSKKMMLLEVAKLLPQPFSLQQLTIAAWREHPLEFGMREHIEYPSEHAVRCAFYGRHGLVGRGQVTKEGERYRVI